MKNDFSNIGELDINIYDDEDLSLNKIFIVLNKSVPNEKDVRCKLRIKELIKLLDNEFELSENPNQIRQFDHVSNLKKNHKVQHVVNGNIVNYGYVKYFLFPKEGLMLSLTKNQYKILYDSRITQSYLSDLETKIQLYIKPKKTKKKHFYMIVNEYNSFDLRKFKIKKYDIDINLNYNNDFSVFDKSVKQFLGASNESGMVLMHGISGSGKTSYIRHLISSLNKKFIFLPLFMAESLTNPEFLPFLMDNKNSILIIEDAEKIIKSRDTENTSNGIATLLNISDGLLGDALGLKIICTFNTGLEKIDKALMRKGRMINRYEFKELSIEKATIIAKKNNLNYKNDIPITLGNLYNIGKENVTGETEKKHIGF